MMSTSAVVGGLRHSSSSAAKYLGFASTTSKPEEILTKMGFTKTLIREGNGQLPKKGQSVTVHCTGYGKNRDMNSKFWSTKDPGQEPFTFRVGMGEVIKGWDESVIAMSIGEVAKIHCSPDYAYGAGGFPAWGIQPNSELIFEIEVLKYK
jgi:peptidylprolyl isomerase